MQKRTGYVEYWDSPFFIFFNEICQKDFFCACRGRCGIFFMDVYALLAAVCACSALYISISSLIQEHQLRNKFLSRLPWDYSRILGYESMHIMQLRKLFLDRIYPPSSKLLQSPLEAVLCHNDTQDVALYPWVWMSIALGW